MKKVFFLAGILILAAGTAFAAAPDRVGHVDLGIYGAGAFNEDVDDAGLVGANLSYGVQPWLALGVSGSWQESDGAADETVGAASVFGDIILRCPYVHDQIVPYGVVGLGVIGAYVTDDDGAAPNNNGDDVDDTSFGWKIGGGFDWFLTENWVANFEVAYYDASADLPGSSVSDVSWVAVGGGLKFVF